MVLLHFHIVLHPSKFGIFASSNSTCNVLIGQYCNYLLIFKISFSLQNLWKLSKLTGAIPPIAPTLQIALIHGHFWLNFGPAHQNPNIIWPEGLSHQMCLLQEASLQKQSVAANGSEPVHSGVNGLIFVWYGCTKISSQVFNSWDQRWLVIFWLFGIKVILFKR